MQTHTDGTRALSVAGPARTDGTIAVAVLALAVLLALPCWASSADDLTVNVYPRRAHASPGAPLTFTATVLNAGGEVVPAELAWSVIPPRVGTISSDGSFVAGAEPGRAIVRAVATYGAATGAGHSSVVVGETPSARLAVAIEPPSGEVDAGGTEQFRAVVTDPATGEPVDAELRWAVLPERLGSIDATGLFTAGMNEGAGRVAVRAADGVREGVGDVPVIVGSPPEPGVSVTVAPAQALLGPGEEFRFTAVIVDDSGEPVDIDVEWNVMPRRLGVIDASGLFTAGPDEGVGRIVATVATSGGPVRGFARVEVRRPGPAGVRVHVRPREAAVLLGGEVQFEAVALGPDGEPLNVPIEWSLRPGWLGTVSPDGLFTAADEMPEPPGDAVWTGAVVASVETSEGVASDAARVIVRDSGPALQLRVHPRQPVVAPGQDIQFEERVIGAEGPNDWTTEWAVFPRDIGVITPDGLFTANPAFGDPSSPDFGPHEGAVGAMVTLPDGSTLTDRAIVRVRTPGHPVSVRVRPALAMVVPGQTTHFEAEVLGPAGELLDLPVEWNVSPGHIGTITDNGLFTAADVHIDPDAWNRPRGLVVAEVRVAGGQVFRGAAAVIFDLPDPEVFVHVSPKSVTLAEGEQFGFEAEAVAGDGSVVEVEWEWRVTDEVLGTIDDTGLFTAATSIPQQHGRRTTVVAGCVHNGRLYADFATVRLSR